jgi:hypothetical protein
LGLLRRGKPFKRFPYSSVALFTWLKPGVNETGKNSTTLGVRITLWATM